jgi:tetratricopeptide (TPR) repeat protein
MNPLRITALLACSAASLCARDAGWTRLEARDFTIISHLSKVDTLVWAIEFEQFHRGLANVLELHEDVLRPVTVVLFRSLDEMDPYKPLENGKPQDIGGMFIRAPMGNFIEAAADSEDEETRRTIYYEGVNWLTNVSDVPLPLWLEAGLAEVFSTFSVKDDHYSYGKVMPENVALLNSGKMMPLKKLMDVPNGTLKFNEGRERTDIVYAESWAFVHYLLFSGRFEERPRFNELVRALRPGSDPDGAFKDVFGADCATMDQRLRGYLTDGTYSMSRIKFDRASLEHSFTVRRASPAEVDLAQCSILAATGRSAEALPRLQRAALELKDNPLAWEAQGFAAFQTQDYDESDSCFKRAADLGSRDFFVFSYLGDSALGLRPGRITPSAGGNVRLAVDYYERGLAINPGEEHAYDCFAGNSYALDSLTDQDAATLRQGSRIFPSDMMIQVGLAVTDLKQGRVEEAKAVLQRIAEDPSPPEKNARDYAQFILDDRVRFETVDRLRDLWDSQDFDGVVTLVDQALKTKLIPVDRENMRRLRDRAEVASDIGRARQLLASGQASQARSLLLEADAKAADPQMKAQIHSLLDRIANPGPSRKP